ncbi:MAG: tRNA nucleotidyltransferase, partial [Oscillospiraceae bacterium]|nr:tRNA nucleotidyltransferase [Oscillospiraceae bacterium]
MEWKGLHAGSVKCLNTLWGIGYAAYPVGGCVRDLLLGREPGDVDICTAAHPETVMNLFEKAIPTGLPHGTVTIPTETGNVEITTFRREGGYADARHPDSVTFNAGLLEDLSRRDFTVNAMALGPEGNIIDPFGGREDLERGVIRSVGEPDRRFSEDALRMLRGVRFCAQLGFTMEEETAAALRRN